MQRCEKPQNDVKNRHPDFQRAASLTGAGGHVISTSQPPAVPFSANGSFIAQVAGDGSFGSAIGSTQVDIIATVAIFGTQAVFSDAALFAAGTHFNDSGTLIDGPCSTKVYPQQAPTTTTTHSPIAPILDTPAAHAADDGSAMIAALAEDDEHLLTEEHQLLQKADWSAARATASAPLLRVNRSNLPALLTNVNLDYNLRCSLFSFLSRYKRSQWMQWQQNYPQRIGISLVADWEYGKAMALCGVHNWLCQQSDYCPRCALMNRATPCAREYLHSFEQAPYWYAISPSFEVNSNRAGLRYVIQKADKKKGIPQSMRRFNPYKGREAGVALTSDSHLADGEANPVIACFTTIFQLADKLVKCGLAGGILAHREAAWHFRPHRVTPNGHLLVNTPVPLTFEMGREILFLFERLYQGQPLGRSLYPDLHIEPLLSQREVNRWIHYMFKPMDYVTGYLQSVQAGVDIGALNLEMDERVFQGGAVILSAKSPRRYGNLSCKVKNGDKDSTKEAHADGVTAAGATNTPSKYIGGGSVTAWRKEQTAKRKAARERLGLPPAKPQRGESRLSRVIAREAHRRHDEF